MGDGGKAVRERDVRSSGSDACEVTAEKRKVDTGGGGWNCSQLTGETGIYGAVSCWGSHSGEGRLDTFKHFRGEKVGWADDEGLFRIA